MQYHDILLPDFISVHLKGGPVFATSTASTISGREIRIYTRQNSIQKYSLVGCRLSRDEFEWFNGFFRARMGSAYAFRIRDHADFVIQDQIIGIGDGIEKEFEICKIYLDDASNYRRKICAVRFDTLAANFDIEKIDNVHGIITARNVIEVQKEAIISCEFDVWVRFGSDEFRYSSADDGSILIEDLELIEVTG